MSLDETLHRVKELRAQGRSPKQIARVLGLRPAEAARLVRAVAEEGAADTPEPEVTQCWVNAGWSDGLTVEGDLEWPDPGGSAGSAGLATVIVARRHRWDKLSVCCYLVDVYCLGVKNTIGPRVMDELELTRFLDQCYSAFDSAPVAAPLDLAQHLVLGAVDYARTLGFEPWHEFPETRGHLGEWTGPSAIRFGCDGKPNYVQGPHDDPRRVIRTLQRSVGDGNFHFTMVAG